MSLKHIASLLIMLLLAAALALPAFAAPDEIVTATEAPNDLVTGAGMTVVPGGEETTDAPPILIYAPAPTEPQTTIAIVPISTDLLSEDGAELLSQRNLTLAAFALSGFAVLLSIAALLRTRKKTAPNATGNYQKYF